MSDALTTLSLSDNRIVTIKYVELVDLLLDGNIPDPLTGMVEGMIAQTMEALGTATTEEKDLAQAHQAAEYDHDLRVRLIRHVVCVSCVEPRVVVALGEAQQLRRDGVPVLHISQLNGIDQLAIYYAAQGMVAALTELFRNEGGESDAVEPVPDGAGDAPATEHAAGDPEAAEVGALHGEHGGEPVGPVGADAAGRVGRRGRTPQAEVRTGTTVERPKRTGKRRG